MNWNKIFGIVRYQYTNTFKKITLAIQEKGGEKKQYNVKRRIREDTQKLVQERVNLPTQKKKHQNI